MDNLFQIAVLRSLIFMVNGRLRDEISYEEERQGKKLLDQLNQLLPLFEHRQRTGQ